ncbi:unnamed protein product [Cylindrotheca closterium]|uniref:Uncharacterized protein n=1 Tax=Cylindrotheca closterium TaxID=2856 RepID=A0AAD2FCX9_9STRA|nr:unnamed protein product [Cylindrotheca closterium]
MSDSNNEQALARTAVMECEQEIQIIKASLRKLSASESDAPNSLEILLVKVEGTDSSSSLKVNLQLSSPVEDATLTKMYDPSNSEPSDDVKATFHGVATAVSTLTVSVIADEKEIGSSAPHDLAPLCVVNAIDQNDRYETEVPIGIVANGSGDESKAEGQDKKVTNEGEDSTEAKVIQPTCTLTLRLVYQPSNNDKKEELYQLLNKKSEKKASALENLRKISMNMARTGTDGSPSKSAATAVAKPSVKPGFLNKKKAEASKVRSFYERTLGPNSIVRTSLGLLFLTKDYLIFFGAISFFHFGGQFLALPAPA